MLTTKGLWYTAAVLGTLSVGVYLGRLYERKTVAAAASERIAAPTTDALAALRAENRQLNAQLAANPERPPAKLIPLDEKTALRSPPPNQLSVLADLQKRRLVTMNMPFVDRHGKLTPGFVELFALAPSEHVALQQIIDRARDRLGELERKNSTVSHDPNGAVVISVAPFPEAGGAAYDQFAKSFADTLGPERYAAFLTLGIQQVERSLAQFGAGQRTVTIWETVGADGAPSYRVTDAQKQPQGHSTSNSQFRTPQDLIENLGTLGSLLPPDSLPQPATSRGSNRP